MATNNGFLKLRWLLIILFSFISWPGYAAIITNVRVNHFDNYTRVIFSINSPDQYHVFKLDGPHRVVVDFFEGHLRANIKDLDYSETHIIKARSGRPVPDTLRIVFDVTGSVKVKSSYIAANNPGEGELVVDIFSKNNAQTASTGVTPAAVATVIDAVSAMVAKAMPMTEPTPKPAPVAVTEAVPSKPVPVVVAETKPVTVTQTVTTVEQIPKPVPQVKIITKTVIKTVHKVKPQLVQSRKPHLIVVMIDPGHGGKDTGTIGGHGANEKDIVLSIAQRLAEYINHEPNMRAVLTRNGDYFVTLQNRLMLSRQSKADLFIAIHADSYFNDQQIGASVYALSHHGASSMAARWLADRENHSELGGVDLNGLGDKSYILRSVLIDLAQTATITDSLKLGSDVLDGLENVTTLHYPHVEQAPFMVLKSPDIPSVLVETGFLSNPKEEERLRDVQYRDKMARALFDGIHRYVATHPMMAMSMRPETAT